MESGPRGMGGKFRDKSRGFCGPLRIQEAAGMTERSDGGTDARIQARKSYRGDIIGEPVEGGRDRGEVCRSEEEHGLAKSCKASD